jgi:hypothetical protein
MVTEKILQGLVEVVAVDVAPACDGVFETTPAQANGPDKKSAARYEIEKSERSMPQQVGINEREQGEKNSADTLNPARCVIFLAPHGIRF